MAENKLEGFEDFDNSPGAGQKAGGGGGELDDLLGKGESGAPAEGGDSELDSFFEDLSTIDDLEVAQEQPKPAAAPAAAAAAPREAPAPAPRAPRKPKAPSKPGRLRRALFYLVLLAVFGGGGYYAYNTYFVGEGKLPWPTLPIPQLPSLPTPRVAPPIETIVPERPTAPVRPARAAPRPTGPGFGIQVATCFFDSCVTAYKSLLQGGSYPVRVKERMSQSETLEVYSQTAFANRQVAQEAAERVNLENRLEGHAYVIEEHSAFRLSMGAFQDLARANVVKDTLNQRYGGQIVFGHRLKTVPYTLKVVTSGSYATRADAEQALDKLRSMDRSLAGAFVIPNAR